MKKFKYISHLTIEEINNNVIIPCIDEDGMHSILIKNSINKSVSSRFVTDNLSIQINSILYIKDKMYYFHIIKSTKNDLYSLGQFHTIFEYIFKKIEEPVNGNELSSLITSLEDYFKVTPDPNLLSLQIGVYGELLTIKYLYENGYKNIIKKYHENFYSKHDIELDQKNRIEIKTTVSEKRIHSFKHNQIYRKDVNVYVSSVMLESSKEGVSLFNLFEDVIELYDNPDSILELRKLMKKCNVNTENEGPSYSLEKAYDDIKIFNSVNLPRLEIDAPDGVTNIKYDVDCSNSISESLSSFIEYLNLFN